MFKPLGKGKFKLKLRAEKCKGSLYGVIENSL